MNHKKMRLVDQVITVLHKCYETLERKFTCKRFAFIKQPLLVSWYVETFGHKFLHCGDLFIFIHLKHQQYDDAVILHDDNILGSLAEQKSNFRGAEPVRNASIASTLHKM